MPANAGLRATSLVGGPGAGGHAVRLEAVGSWAATSNDGWLHTASSGTGGGTVSFTFDANAGATRTGTVTVGGETLTVVQAGAVTSAGSARPPSRPDSTGRAGWPLTSPATSTSGNRTVRW